MVQSFRKRKEDFSRNMKTLLCLKHVGLMVMAGLKSDAWVQTLIPLCQWLGRSPLPGPQHSCLEKIEGVPPALKFSSR